MGIQGLLPCLKSITKTVHIGDFRGQRVAVDAYCWLHKGAYACSRELCEGTPTDKHVKYCMGRVELLLYNGVTPIVVFDGGRLPMKQGEEGARARSRQEYREKALAHLEAGNTTAAFECFQRAVDITPQIAKSFMQALDAVNVEYIVAPYEADAQLAYLAINSHVDAVITEDSDLLPYGAPQVLFKMDKTGSAQLIRLADLPRNRELSFAGFSHQMFLEVCILAGCDFLKALAGIGVKKAHSNMKRLRSFTKVIKSLRFNGTPVPSTYERDFQRALWTFYHQRVYCPRQKKLVHLRDIPPGGLAAGGIWVPSALPGEEEADLPFLGPVIPDSVAEQVAKGEICPFTQEPLVGHPTVGAGGARPAAVPVARNLQAADNTKLGGAVRKRVSGTKKPLPVEKGGIMGFFAEMIRRDSGKSAQFSAPRSSQGQSSQGLSVSMTAAQSTGSHPRKAGESPLDDTATAPIACGSGRSGPAAEAPPAAEPGPQPTRTGPTALAPALHRFGLTRGQKRAVMAPAEPAGNSRLGVQQLMEPQLQLLDAINVVQNMDAAAAGMHASTVRSSQEGDPTDPTADPLAPTAPIDEPSCSGREEGVAQPDIEAGCGDGSYDGPRVAHRVTSTAAEAAVSNGPTGDGKENAEPQARHAVPHEAEPPTCSELHGVEHMAAFRCLASSTVRRVERATQRAIGQEGPANPDPADPAPKLLGKRRRLGDRHNEATLRRPYVPPRRLDADAGGAKAKEKPEKGNSLFGAFAFQKRAM